MRNQFLTRTATLFITCLAVLALFSSSCKTQDDEEEQGDGNGYKITFEVDGVAKEFSDKDFPPIGVFTDDGKQFTGHFAATGRASSVGFQVYDTKAIVKHDYIGYVITPTSGHNMVYGAVVSYTDGQLSYSTQSITNPTVQVEITEITTISVRGKFSGSLKSQSGKPDIRISKGDFFVQRGIPTY